MAFESVARRLHYHVWEQGLWARTFNDQFAVLDQRLVAEKHSRPKLRSVGAGASSGKTIDAILFGQTEAMPDRTAALYRFASNFYSDSYALALGIGEPLRTHRV